MRLRARCASFLEAAEIQLKGSIHQLDLSRTMPRQEKMRLEGRILEVPTTPAGTGS